MNEMQKSQTKQQQLVNAIIDGLQKALELQNKQLVSINTQLIEMNKKLANSCTVDKTVIATDTVNKILVLGCEMMKTKIEANHA